MKRRSFLGVLACLPFCGLLFASKEKRKPKEIPSVMPADPNPDNVTMKFTVTTELDENFLLVSLWSGYVDYHEKPSPNDVLSVKRMAIRNLHPAPGFSREMISFQDRPFNGGYDFQMRDRQIPNEIL